MFVRLSVQQNYAFLCPPPPLVCFCVSHLCVSVRNHCMVELDGVGVPTYRNRVVIFSCFNHISYCKVYQGVVVGLVKNTKNQNLEFYIDRQGDRRTPFPPPIKGYSPIRAGPPPSQGQNKFYVLRLQFSNLSSFILQ